MDEGVRVQILSSSQSLSTRECTEVDRRDCS
jgi:hypothetical protein